MFFILFLVIAAGIGYLAWQMHQRTIQTWQRVASELGLRSTAAGRLSRPVIDGDIAGHPVRIDTYTQRSGNSNTTYTRYRIGFPPLRVNLTLKREGFISAVTKLFGAQDVEVGDQAFDATFQVKTSDPNRLRGLMTPSVRSGLLRFTAAYRDSAISDDHLRVTTRGFERNGARIKSTVQRMVATAQLLASPSAGVSDDIVIDRERGMLEEVAGRLRQRVEESPEDVDQRIFEVETLAAAGEDDVARERLTELEQLAPADPEVAGWRATLNASPAAPKRVQAVGADELAEELFGGTDLSFETRDKFNSRYVGVEIEWQGRVKSVKATSQGTRVVATVATVEHDLYGNTDIDVVLDNPGGSAVEAGQTVTVTGTLATIDPLVRNLFVKSARLS